MKLVLVATVPIFDEIEAGDAVTPVNALNAEETNALSAVLLSEALMVLVIDDTPRLPVIGVSVRVKLNSLTFVLLDLV